ncbi:MAG TPA: nucleoside deaminase, partial [Longimicrobiales bacterium]
MSVPPHHPDPAPTRPLTLEIRLSLPNWVADFADYGKPYRSDQDRMRLAIALARENVRRRSGGPFAAAVFEREGGRLVSVGLNRVEPLGCSSAHAEVLALALAQRRVGRFTLHAPELPAHEIVSSCAPCAMCLGAVLWSGARRLVWGALREDALAIGFDEGPVFPESLDYLRRRGI